MRFGPKWFLQVRRTILPDAKQTTGESRIARMTYAIETFSNRFRHRLAHVLSSQLGKFAGELMRLLILYVETHERAHLFYHLLLPFYHMIISRHFSDQA